MAVPVKSNKKKSMVEKTRSKWGGAFQSATKTAWKNPVMKMSADPRKVPDLAGEFASNDFNVFASEYFPGWLVSSKGKELALFHRIPQVWRIGGPTRLAFSTGGKAEECENYGKFHDQT